MPVAVGLEVTDDLELHLALRHKIFCESELLRCPGPARYGATGDDPHLDEFDRHALTLCVLHEGAPVATGRLVVGPRLPSASFLRESPGFPRDLDLTRGAEPSKFGLLAEHQGTSLGSRAIHRLIGAVVHEAGLRNLSPAILCLRPAMFGLLRWVPWQMYAPFHLPRSIAHRMSEEPLFPVTLLSHELVTAAMAKPMIAELVFPEGTPEWFDPSRSRSPREVDQVALGNVRQFRAHMTDWREAAAGHPVRRESTGAPFLLRAALGALG